MRWLLFSSTEFGRDCLFSLARAGMPPCGIATTPESIKISYSQTPVRISRHFDFAPWAEAHGVPCFSSGGKGFDSKACLAWAKSMKADLILVLGWYYMIPEALRSSVSLGAAGIHASLLPAYRGGAPLVWALINGETKVGGTFFWFDEGVDSGDVIKQFSVDVGPGDDIASVYGKVTGMSAGLLVESMGLLAEGKAPRVKQDESKASSFPQRSPKDGRICWAWPAKRVFDFVRAQTRPYPGAFSTDAQGKAVHIWRTAPSSKTAAGDSGSIFLEGGKAFVNCGDSKLLELISVAVEGEEAPVAEALRSSVRFESWSP